MSNYPIVHEVDVTPPRKGYARTEAWLAYLLMQEEDKLNRGESRQYSLKARLEIDSFGNRMAWVYVYPVSMGEPEAVNRTGIYVSLNGPYSSNNPGKIAWQAGIAIREAKKAGQGNE